MRRTLVALVFGTVVAVDLKAKGGEVAHHEVENLVDNILVQSVDFRLLQDELAVDHDGEHLAHSQGEGRIHFLDFVRKGFFQHFLEEADLLDEDGDIRQVLEGLEDGPVVMELDRAQALCRALVE